MNKSNLERWNTIITVGVGVTVIVAAIVWEMTRVRVAPVPQPFIDEVVGSGGPFDPVAVAEGASFRHVVRNGQIVADLLQFAALAVVVNGVREDRWLTRWLPSPILAATLTYTVYEMVTAPLSWWLWSKSVEVGLSNRAFSAWLRDYTITHGVNVLGFVIAISAFVFARRRWPKTVVAMATVTAAAIAPTIVWIAPTVFESLFYNVTPLEQSDIPERAMLHEEIVAIAVAAGESDTIEVVVADASKRTTASNAYVSGLPVPGVGTRHVVLYDTLIRDAEPAEVIAVVAHELGHHTHQDVERAALWASASAVLGAWVLIGVDLFVRRREGSPVAALTVGVSVVIVCSVIVQPVGLAISRTAESAADHFALEQLQDSDVFVSSMVGLSERNLSDVDPPTWSIWAFNTHPPIGERVGRAMFFEATE